MSENALWIRVQHSVPNAGADTTFCPFGDVLAVGFAGFEEVFFG